MIILTGFDDDLGADGFGEAATYAEGPQFKCDPKTGSMAGKLICYGIADVHQEFLAFQQLLNTYATRAGFTALKMDGFIGKGTVAATLAVLQYLKIPAGTSGVSLAKSELEMNPEHRVVAKYLPILKAEFLAPGTTSATPPGSGSSAFTPQHMPLNPGSINPGPPTTPNAPGAVPGAPGAVPSGGSGGGARTVATTAKVAPKVHWMWWAVGGLAAAGVVTVGVMTYTRSKKPVRYPRPESEPETK